MAIRRCQSHHTQGRVQHTLVIDENLHNSCVGRYVLGVSTVLLHHLCRHACAPVNNTGMHITHHACHVVLTLEASALDQSLCSYHNELLKQWISQIEAFLCAIDRVLVAMWHVSVNQPDSLSGLMRSFPNDAPAHRPTVLEQICSVGAAFSIRLAVTVMDTHAVTVLV